MYSKIHKNYENLLEEILRQKKIQREGSPIAKGGFGTLYNVKVDPDLEAIIKILYTKLTNKPKIKQFTNEAAIALNIKIKYIVKSFMVFQQNFQKENLCITGICMEKCTHQDLKLIIYNLHWQNLYKSLLFDLEKRKISGINWLENPSECIIKFFFFQIVLALEFLFRSNLIHLDLKPENIFITDNMQVRLGDFGLTRSPNPKENKFKLVESTEGYMGPEYKQKPMEVETKYAYKVDYYSLGCCLYYFTLKEKVSNLNFTFQKIWQSKMTTNLKFLLKSLLSNIKERPNIYQLLNNKWICEDQKEIKNIEDINYNGVSKLLLEFQKLKTIKYSKKQRKINPFFHNKKFQIIL